MEEGLWVAWQAVRGAAKLADQSKPFKVHACMAKVFATETALRIADEAIQLLGGYGYMTDYKVEQNYRDARLLTIGEGASEILRLAIAGNMEAPGFSDELIPSPESLEKEAELTCGSLSTLWGPSLHALKLARNSFQMALEQIMGDGPSGDSSSLRQTTAINVANLATKLWIAGQVMRAGARHANRRAGRAVCLGKSFLAKASLEVCHKAIELLREQGLTDRRLLNNYSAVLEITACDGSSRSSLPLIAEPS
jgi:hypothetical protein